VYIASQHGVKAQIRNCYAGMGKVGAIDSSDTNVAKTWHELGGCLHISSGCT